MEDLKLKCKACGSINTNVYKAKDLAEKTGDRNLLNPTMGFQHWHFLVQN